MIITDSAVATFHRMVDAFNARDLPALAALYDPPVQIADIEARFTLADKDHVLRYCEELLEFQRMYGGETIRVGRIEPMPLGPFYASVKAELSCHDETGAQLFSGETLVVFRRDAGGLRICYSLSLVPLIFPDPTD